MASHVFGVHDCLTDAWCAETSPRESLLRQSEENRQEDRKPQLKEECSVQVAKGVVAQDIRLLTGPKIRKKLGLAGKRSASGAERPPVLTIPNRAVKDAEPGSADPEVWHIHTRSNAE